MAQSNVPKRVRHKLAAYFCRNGRIRMPRRDRRRGEDSQSYKKGYEVRFLLFDDAELEEVQALLERAGLRVATPWRKSNQWIQPLYGEEAADLIWEWAEEYEKERAKRKRKRR